MSVDIKEVRLPQGTIRYWAAGPIDAEPILFVHGLLVNGLLWRKVAPRLAGDYRVIVPDLPLGSHLLPMERHTDLSPPGVARIIDQFMQALGLEGVTIVGNDTGGAISQVLCAEHPKRIARLVLTNCDAYENFPPRAFRFMTVLPRIPGATWEFAQLSRIKAIPRTIFGLLQNTPIDPALLESFTRPTQTQRGIRRDARKALLGVDKRHTMAAADKLRTFDRPVLLAWGTDDPFFPVKWARRLAADLPNARLVEIPDSKTFVMEDAPDRLVELIAGFVRDEPLARAQ
jgi:pimeloyl-ACP methyl ester carboxylesterase